jgi:uncharacterized repeat protein (TIGR04138 family)
MMMNRTIDYYRRGHVSLWVGAFPSVDDADAYFTEELDAEDWKPSPFGVELGLGFYPPSCLEINFEELSPRPVQALLREATFSGSFIRPAVEAAGRRGIHEAQGIALLYDYDYQLKPGWAEAVGPVRFVGTFVFDRGSYAAKFHELAEELGYSVKAVLFVLYELGERSLKRREEQGTATGHVSAREVCEHLLSCRGKDSAALLRGHGLLRSEDVGRVVFGLVNAGLARRQESDSEADFRGLFALD